MVNIFQIKSVCDDLDGNCGACPFGTTEGCPFLSNDPFDWDIEYINKRFENSPFNKEETETNAQHTIPAEPLQDIAESLEKSAETIIELSPAATASFMRIAAKAIRQHLVS